ncbi:MAG: antitoxin MazE family protein [Beijerinckiaceae bacterium]
MSAPAKTTSDAFQKAERNRQKSRNWRARMRAEGLRPVQLWVHDTRDPAFIAECQRQARMIAESPSEAEDQAFVSAVSVRLDELP